MKRNRLWIEIIALGSVMACIVALLIATLGAAVALTAQPASGQEIESPKSQVSPSAPQADSGQSYEGMVTCSMCGAKHSAKLGENASDCTLSCVRAGAKFALVDGDKVYQLDGDPSLLKKIAGQRARIVGIARGNTIQVSSLDAA